MNLKNWPILIAIVVMLGGGFAWAMSHETRLATTETKTLDVREELRLTREELKADVAELKSDVKELLRRSAHVHP